MPHRPRPTAGDRDADLPTRLPATELMIADLPAHQPILDPILATKSLALLYGPRGLGKTFVAMGIAWAAASGTSVLGWQAPRPYRVIYVDGEMASLDLKKRLAAFGPAPATLEFIVSDGMGPRNRLPDLAE